MTPPTLFGIVHTWKYEGYWKWMLTPDVMVRIYESGAWEIDIQGEHTVSNSLPEAACSPADAAAAVELLLRAVARSVPA